VLLLREDGGDVDQESAADDGAGIGLQSLYGFVLDSQNPSPSGDGGDMAEALGDSGLEPQGG
jgi:hypothetical protein